MMDIVERLRGDHSDERLEIAADEIERLREALKHLLRWHDQLSPADIAKAEAALKEGE
jgi:hypothetical protein